MAFRERFFQSFQNVFERYHRFDFQQSAQNKHIESFRVFHFGGGVHGVDTVNVYIGAGRSVVYAVTVIDEYAAGFYFTLEFFERRLIENDGNIKFVENRRADTFIAQYYGNIGRSAPLLRAV